MCAVNDDILKPYILPDGNVQIAFSGGRTSAYMLWHIIQANGGLPERAKVLFENTGREMTETLDFVQECAEQWGVEIVWLEYRLRWTGAPHDVANRVFDSGAHSFEVVSHNSASRNGEPMDDLLEYYGFIPTALSRWCTGRLKTKTAAAYLKSLGWDRWTTATGIRADEPKRTKSDGAYKDRSTAWMPLARAGVTKEDVTRFWSDQNFDLRLPNRDGVTALGNCDGCFLKSEAKKAALARDFPERAAWWAERERKYAGCRSKLGKGAAHEDTFAKNMSWVDLIRDVEKNDGALFDLEDGFCQADGGECLA